MTTIEMFDTDVHAELVFPLDSIPDWFPIDDLLEAELHLVKWPSEPGAVVGATSRDVVVYAGAATYLTEEGDFEAGTYAAQVRLVADDAYGTTADSEVFRLVVHAGV